MTYDPNSMLGQNHPNNPNTACDSQKNPNSTEMPANKCPPLDPGPCTPKLPDLPKCPESCCCPPKPESTSTCLDGMIDEQVQLITEADRAKSFKAELEEILKKAKTAKQEYTKEKYKDLRDKWDKQDTSIVDLITKLVCAVDCWWCLIECEICPLLYGYHNTELKLNGDGTLTDKVYSLRDLRYWKERNRDSKKEIFDRIQLVLAAWDKPAQTLDKILTDNNKLIEDTKKILATDSVTAICNVFFRIVPMHLAIAPRDITSKIRPEYTTFCGCDLGKADNCCGPDVGKWSIRQRLIGPQPYLVDPDNFFDIICCLVKERYLPAKNLLALAESELAKTESEIRRALNDLEQKKDSVLADFKANVVNPIDCDKYKRKNNSADSQTNPCSPPSTSA